jgi:hypothetical protein
MILLWTWHNTNSNVRKLRIRLSLYLGEAYCKDRKASASAIMGSTWSATYSSSVVFPKGMHPVVDGGEKSIRPN